MKLGKSHIHLFILLFAVSSILVHVPSDAYAAVDTWTAATTTNVGTNTMNGVSMSDANNGVAVGHSGQIVYTTNGGVDWTNATTTNVGTGAIRGVSMSDANNGVAVGYMGTIVYTTNGGVDWTAATTTNVSAASMRGVSMIDASNGVAVGQSGQIVYTTNGGVDWTDATTTNVGGTFMLGVSMGDASNGVAVGYSGTIVYTTNGGVDWTAATTTNVGTAYMWGVSMGDANNGVAVGSSGQIVYTTNGGVTWTDATTDVGATHMRGVSMIDANNGVAVGNTGTIVYTTNGGVDWTAATTTNVGDNLMWGVSMIDASNGVAVGQSGQIVFAGSVSSEDNTTTEKSSSDCYDCEAPKLTKVKAHVLSSPLDYTWNFDQDTPYPMFDDDIIPIVADPGDEVEIILELTDNRTLKRIADSGTYTNFLTKPNDMNTFYANNFDEYGKVSTTFYEWHNTGDDLFYDYDQTVEWSDADITIQESGEFVKDGTAENLDGLVGTFTISFKMKFLEPMKTSEVWVQATDRSGNFFKVSLPLTLKITGNEPLLFDSKVNQKVLSFFDESMLFELVSDWNGSSKDVSELTAVLGIPDEQLPSWVTNLAMWVSEDKITLVDMIVSIEHLINN
jgi:photosystem II stability/assembly factor-like uncharacterized protein